GAAAGVSFVGLTVAVVVSVVAALHDAGMHGRPRVIAVAADLPRSRLSTTAVDLALALAVGAQRRAVGVGGIHHAVPLLVQAPRAQLGRRSLVAHAGYGA